jgi:hypothetical protein
MSILSAKHKKYVLGMLYRMPAQALHRSALILIKMTAKRKSAVLGENAREMQILAPIFLKQIARNKAAAGALPAQLPA